MSNRPPRFDPEDGWRAKDGRRFPYTSIGDWVPLSGVSPRAVHVYTLLRMHVNETRNDGKAWPSQGTLAAMLGIKKCDTAAAAIAELVEIGAVDVEVERRPDGRRNTYTVHEAPPSGYDRPTTLNEWYRAKGLLSE